jgi:hypothetical protein
MVGRLWWAGSAPRVELDQRARDARLRSERLERLLAPRAGRGPRAGRLLALFGLGNGRTGRRGRPARSPPGTQDIGYNPDMWPPGSAPARCVAALPREGSRAARRDDAEACLPLGQINLCGRQRAARMPAPSEPPVFRIAPACGCRAPRGPQGAATRG